MFCITSGLTGLWHFAGAFAPSLLGTPFQYPGMEVVTGHTFGGSDSVQICPVIPSWLVCLGVYSPWLVGFRQAGCPSFVDQAGTTDLLLYRNHFFDLVIPASARRLPSGIRWPFRESAKSMIAS